MLWWFLILGVGLILVVSVAISLLMHVRRQMSSTEQKAEMGDQSENSGQIEQAPPEV